MAAVGSTSNVFSYDAVWGENRTNHLVDDVRMRYVLRQDNNVYLHRMCESSGHHDIQPLVFGQLAVCGSLSNSLKIYNNFLSMTQSRTMSVHLFICLSHLRQLTCKVVMYCGFPPFACRALIAPLPLY